MGMYTSLKFTGLLKKEFIKDIREIFINADLDNEDIETKHEWREFAKKYPFAEHFSKMERCLFIPFGDFSAYNEDKYGGNYNNLEWQTWCFACDLKDYNNEIETFLDEIAPVICEKFIAEIWYEVWSFPELYVFDKNIGCKKIVDFVDEWEE